MTKYNRVKDLSSEPWVDCNTFHLVLYRLYDKVYLTRNAISGAVEEVICDDGGSPMRYGDVVYEISRSIPLTNRGEVRKTIHAALIKRSSIVIDSQN